MRTEKKVYLALMVVFLVLAIVCHYLAGTAEAQCIATYGVSAECKTIFMLLFYILGAFALLMLAALIWPDPLF